jgi:hypothetical protein
MPGRFMCNIIVATGTVPLNFFLRNRDVEGVTYMLSACLTTILGSGWYVTE